eukprot:6951109-Pyramimonas_sp.AAC.1
MLLQDARHGLEEHAFLIKGLRGHVDGLGHVWQAALAVNQDWGPRVGLFFERHRKLDAADLPEPASGGGG